MGVSARGSSNSGVCSVSSADAALERKNLRNVGASTAPSMRTSAPNSAAAAAQSPSRTPKRRPKLWVARSKGAVKGIVAFESRRHGKARAEDRRGAAQGFSLRDEDAAPVEKHAERCGLRASGHCDRERDAFDTHPRTQQVTESERDQDDRERGEQRQSGPLAREERLGEDLGERRARQRQGEPARGPRGLCRVMRREHPMLEKHRDDGRRKGQEAECGRQRYQERELAGAVDDLGLAASIVVAHAPRDLGEQHRSHGDRDEAERQLIEPVCVIEPGYTAGQRRGDLGRRDDGHLRRPARRDAGKRQKAEASQFRRPARAHDRETDGASIERHQEPERLGEARKADEARERARAIGLGVVDEPQRDQHHDQDDIDDDGGERRAQETPFGVECRGHQRGEHRKSEEREGQPRIFHGEREFQRIVREARREEQHETRRREIAPHGERDEEHAGARDRPMREEASLLLSLFGPQPLMHGHESRVERAFAEHASEQVRQPERHEEGVGDEAGAERRGDQGVAHETEQSRERCSAADEKHRFGEGHRVSGFRAVFALDRSISLPAF